MPCISETTFVKTIYEVESININLQLVSKSGFGWCEYGISLSNFYGVDQNALWFS